MDEIKKISEFKWEIPTGFKDGMRVPGTVFADDELMRLARRDRALEQVANVAFLPGIVYRSLAMPDIHWGYGFPIGGVAAFGPDGIVSPGGVGFDISCGVRLVKTSLTEGEVRKDLDGLLTAMAATIPRGLGTRGRIQTPEKLLRKVFSGGARAVLAMGYGRQDDLEHTEGGGTWGGADPDRVSSRAYERGKDQLGTLGSGNHFVEVQVVEKVLDEGVARVFGLEEGQVTVMIHSGSRGVGHQIATDYLQVMDRVTQRLGQQLPDRQLSCAPLESSEASDYMAAMACACNYAVGNRQALMHWVRHSFERHFGSPEGTLGMDLLFDVSHNVARMETHRVEGRTMELCVHRKGATSAFPAGHPLAPAAFRDVGQPVIIPGDMGTHSYVLVGGERSLEESFASTCHGAGRTMSRSKARKMVRGSELRSRLASQGILVRAGKDSLLAEEAPEAYKDVSRVVDVCEGAGLSRKVAMLSPMAVLKG
ncbi:MAG: RtcB family protein [Actinobacteria bacterium]|nr:RtcB family protein [Actinomycetota bacterium]MBU1943604.1 RtcB family protein [Actinomycetota bacterium]MBU2688937.1 RtcB family protein [Actinomycetota bacterium]